MRNINATDRSSRCEHEFAVQLQLATRGGWIPIRTISISIAMAANSKAWPCSGLHNIDLSAALALCRAPPAAASRVIIVIVVHHHSPPALSLRRCTRRQWGAIPAGELPQIGVTAIADSSAGLPSASHGGWRAGGLRL